MIKMIVSDVDGTLLSHGYINPKCIESIKKAQAKGIEFVVASGRDYYGVTSVLDPLGIKCSAILGMVLNIVIKKEKPSWIVI